MSSPKVSPPVVPLMGMYGGEDIAILLRESIKSKPPAPGKCLGCGSRHFVTHNARRICSYCRGEQ